VIAMPVRVKLPTLLRKYVGGEPAVEASVGENGHATVRDLLDELGRRYPGLTDSIVTGEGDIHRFVNLYVNGEDVRYLGALDARVKEGDTVAILPAVAGGSGTGSRALPS
jgi:molybdopterin synthase sulfur carrier subunit